MWSVGASCLKPINSGPGSPGLKDVGETGTEEKVSMKRVYMKVDASVLVTLRRVVKPDKLDKKEGCSSGIPKYLISFKESASDEVVQYILKQLEGEGLQCEIGSSRYATVSAEFKVLAKQASNN